MKKVIEIQIPEGYNDVKFNKQTNEIEFIKKDNKPRSWEEYCEQEKNSPCYIAYFNHLHGNIGKYNNRYPSYYVNAFNTEEEAKAYIALGKLIQLRDAWWGDWRPEWDNTSKSKYVISFVENKIYATLNCGSSRILAFPTEEMRDDFLKTFGDLIEEAKMLL